MNAIRHRIARNLLLCTAAFMAATSGVAYAQQQAATDQPKIEEIVVTGSRIPVTSLAIPSPISITTAQQIEMTDSFGLEDVLTKMIGPDSTGGTTANSNNGGVGVSQIGLRNLGPSRTLVLVDGQRLVPIWGATFSAPDLNSVPLAMVERIEVLRDGASSIYGADAIGGVINIITKKDFSGFQVDVNGGLSQHGGGNNYSVSGTAGFNVDKGNITISLLNEKETPVGQWQRAWAANANASDPNFPFGSAYRSQLDILQDSNSSTVWLNNKQDTYKDSALVNSVPCLAYSPVSGRVKLNAGCDTPEGGWNTLTGGLERTQINMSGHYDLADNITFIMQGNFTDRISTQFLRPEPLLGDSIGSVNFTNGSTIFPGFYVPADPRWGYPGGGTAVPCADPTGCIDAYLTPVQFGPRSYRQYSDTFRVRTGLEGTIFGDYKWEAGFVAQRNNTTQEIYNSGQFQHIAQETGEAPCVDVPGGCTTTPPTGWSYNIPLAPINFFNGPNMLTAAQLAYITFTDVDKAISDQNYVYADINGSLFQLPAGDVKAAAGFEHRAEHLEQTPDSLEQTGYAANHSEPTIGGYRTDSEYGELDIPLLKNVPGAVALDLKPSVRHDANSQFGDATTWKVGGDYQAIDSLRFRANYATGFRAPSLSELYNANQVSFVSVDGDPCDSRKPINGNSNMGLASLAAGSTCYNALTALGLTPAQIATYQSPENNLASDQRGFVLGGSSALQPEKSRQWTAGTVITPDFIPGLTITADYYFIKIINAIADGGIALEGSPDFVPLGCYVQQIQSFCKLINRNANGIFQVSSANTNFGVAHVRGLDLEASYLTKLSAIGLNVPGTFGIDIKAEDEITNNQSNPDGSVTNYVGFFNTGNESIQPKWRGTINLDYTWDPVHIHWDINYIQGTDDLGGVDRVPGDFIPDAWYHNISVSYDLTSIVQSSTDVIKKTQIIFGINNLLDKDPPYLAVDSICKCNSLAGPYDFVGRFFYTRLTAKF